VVTDTESGGKFNVKAYQLLLDMKSMCERKRAGVSLFRENVIVFVMNECRRRSNVLTVLLVLRGFRWW